MLSFTQYETKDFEISFEISGVLDNYSKVIVTLDQDKTQLVKTTEDLEITDDIINVHLTQEDTGMFLPGNIEVQVNIYYEDTERDATYIQQATVLRNNYKQVITNE